MTYNVLKFVPVRVELDKDYPKLGKFTGATDAINSIDIGNDGTQCLAGIMQFESCAVHFR